MTVKDKAYNHNADWLGQILKNWQAQSLSSDPATTYPRIYWNTTSFKYRYYDTNAAAWADLGAAPAAGSVTNTMLANMAQATIKGRAAGAGTGVPVDLSASQVKTILAIVSADVSDLATVVKAYRLDEFAAPTSDLSVNSHKITSLTSGTADSDAVNLGQVKALLNGLDFAHENVQVVATTALPACTYANGTAGVGATLTANANGAFPAVDGITLTATDTLPPDVLVAGQVAGLQNGVYRLTTTGTGGTPWVLTRRTDLDEASELEPGVAIVVAEGTNAHDTIWLISTDTAIVVGTTAISWLQLPSVNDLTAGTGLTRTGNTVDANAGTTPATSAGPGGGLKANADDLVIDATIVPRKYTALIGDGATVDITITHSLNNAHPHSVRFEDASTGEEVSVVSAPSSASAIVAYFPSAIATNALRVDILA